MSHNGIAWFKGRLVADPEFKTGSGWTLAKLRIAVKREVPKKGQTKLAEVSDFFDVTAWGKVADGCRRLRKGDPVAMEVEPSIESWEENGQKRRKVAFKASVVALVMWGDGPTRNAPVATQSDPGAYIPPPPPDDPGMEPPPMDGPPELDDVPF